MKIVDASFYDKDIYKKRPETTEEAEDQLIKLMDDLTAREEIVKKKFRWMVLGLSATEIAVSIVVVLLLRHNSSAATRYGEFVTLVNASCCLALGAIPGKLKKEQKYYQKIKESVETKTFTEDPVAFTCDMLDKVKLDIAKGR